VTSLAEFATTDGLHHMSGNVSEYVFDIAVRYEGSESKFKFDNSGFLARGGGWKDESYVMLAADRIWDMGSAQIGNDDRAEVFGFRTAAYPRAGCDLALELYTYAQEFNRMKGAAHWLPAPVGLSARDRTKRDKRQVLQGFGFSRTAGWMQRRLDADAANHAYVTGAAKGVAFLPIKGISQKYLKNANSLLRWSLAEEETAFVGAIVATDNCTITLQNELGEPIQIDMGDESSSAWAGHDLGFVYQVGLWLVLRGDKVAVFGGEPGSSGMAGKHLNKIPLGYLPTNWETRLAITADAQPSAKYADGIATLTVPLPMLDRNGAPRRGGKSALLTVRVPAAFR